MFAHYCNRPTKADKYSGIVITWEQYIILLSLLYWKINLLLLQCTAIKQQYLKLNLWPTGVLIIQVLYVHQLNLDILYYICRSYEKSCKDLYASITQSNLYSFYFLEIIDTSIILLGTAPDPKFVSLLLCCSLS